MSASKGRLSFRTTTMMRIAKLSRDPWIATHSVILSAEKLHALGVITAEWSAAEYNLFALFCMVRKSGSEAENWILVHDLGDIAIATRIKELAMRRFKSGPTLDTILNALDCYDVCRRNRNTLTHFSLSMGHPTELRLVRRSKRPDSIAYEHFPDGVWDIRRVARDIDKLNSFMSALWTELIFLNSGEVRPLPSKRRVPQLLWEPPSQVPTKPSRQPKSSPASRRKAALAKRGK